MRAAMKTISLSIVLIWCAVIGCKEPAGIDDSQLQTASTIKPGTFKVTADVTTPVLDRPITITTTCLPLITGKGVIGLTGRRWGDMFDWLLRSPVNDTTSFVDDPYYTIHIPAEFKANETFTQKWSVQLLPRTKPAGRYYFGGHIYIDSIFIADSNKMYWIRSEVARKHCPRRLGWEPHAINDGNLYL